MSQAVGLVHALRNQESSVHVSTRILAFVLPLAGSGPKDTFSTNHSAIKLPVRKLVPESLSQKVVPERPRRVRPRKRTGSRGIYRRSVPPSRISCKTSLPPLLRKDVSKSVLCCNSAAVRDRCMRGRELR